MNRRELIEKIFFILHEYNISKENIKGSFLEGDFHFIHEKKITFSDIDLMIVKCLNPKEKAESISKAIFEISGVLVPVSIHTKNSLTKLSLKESQELALLECIYQINRRDFKESLIYRTYIFSKFSLLISRISVDEIYKEVVSRLNSKDATIWYDIKLGRTSNLDVQNVNWPKVNKNSLFWELFFQKKITTKHAREFYMRVMDRTSLSDDLKGRIKQKLDQVDFWYGK